MLGLKQSQGVDAVNKAGTKVSQLEDFEMMGKLLVQVSMLIFYQVHKAALGRRMGPFRARVEKLGSDNLHLAPTNTNQAANQVDLKLDDEEGSALDMDQSL